MIVLNEKVFAEKCIDEGYISEKPYETLLVLAKYYRHYMGFGQKKTYETLKTFMGKYYPKYSLNISSWEDTINKVVRFASKRELCQISEIWITDSEINTINSIETRSKYLRQLAFTLLCIAKVNNAKESKNNNWVTIEAKDIFKYAHINVPAKRQDEMLGDLQILGLIEFAKKNDNLSNRVLFIDESGNKILKIDDFREIGYVYLKYMGENIIVCEKCGILTRGASNGLKKYCHNCAMYSPKKTKIKECIDCGRLFVVSSKDNKSYRCPKCKENVKKGNSFNAE